LGGGESYDDLEDLTSAEDSSTTNREARRSILLKGAAILGEW
jgi:hypothetical protein